MLIAIEYKILHTQLFMFKISICREIYKRYSGLLFSTCQNKLYFVEGGYLLILSTAKLNIFIVIIQLICIKITTTSKTLQLDNNDLLRSSHILFIYLLLSILDFTYSIFSIYNAYNVMNEMISVSFIPKSSGKYDTKIDIENYLPFRFRLLRACHPKLIFFRNFTISPKVTVPKVHEKQVIIYIENVKLFHLIFLLKRNSIDCTKCHYSKSNIGAAFKNAKSHTWVMSSISNKITTRSRSGICCKNNPGKLCTCDDFVLFNMFVMHVIFQCINVINNMSMLSVDDMQSEVVKQVTHLFFQLFYL